MKCLGNPTALKQTELFYYMYLVLTAELVHVQLDKRLDLANCSVQRPLASCRWDKWREGMKLVIYSNPETNVEYITAKQAAM